MTSDREIFVQGVSAFRNARGPAERHRNRFIQEANARASQAGTATSQADLPETHEYEIPTRHGSIDPAPYITFQDADDAPQQHIAHTSNYELQDDGEAVTIHSYLYSEDDSQEPGRESVAPGDDPSISFTSSLSADPSRAKRSRQSLSPAIQVQWKSSIQESDTTKHGSANRGVVHLYYRIGAVGSK
ncbi:hypothetical protein DL769_003622 [Monosporascus sp. CRB-8-3]|nr:hypothetical protein DL769_003622 [Monosporascus sp. CRB-8-3]